jgi:plastocyanin
MKKRILMEIGLIGLLGSGLFFSCSKSSLNEDDQTVSTSSANDVSIKSSGFVPQETITARGTITWFNSDTRPHTVTSNIGMFDSGTIQPGESFSFTFTRIGSYEYYDKNSSARGRIEVQGRDDPVN